MSLPGGGGGGRSSGAGMSGSGAAPGPGSSQAACRFAHYFVLCGIDADSGLEPDELAGKARLWRRGGPRGDAREAGCRLQTKSAPGGGARSVAGPALGRVFNDIVIYSARWVRF